MKENREMHEELGELLGCELKEVRLRSLRGGMVASSVLHATARYTDSTGRARSRTMVIKALDPKTAREARIYRHLAQCDLSDHLPRVWGVAQTGEGSRLFLEAIRPADRWPWRELSPAQTVLQMLARLHAAALSAEMRGILTDWDYERELAESAVLSLEEFEAAARRPEGRVLRAYAPPLRRSVRRLTEMRRELLGYGPLGACMIHGDVHSGNVIVRRRSGRAAPVLLDWARARIGSPLEDVSSWLQSLLYWEPQVRRRHDTLLSSYLAARSLPVCLGPELRRMYWVAAASNALAGALRYHLHRFSCVPPARRHAALAAAEHSLKILRRADAYCC